MKEFFAPGRVNLIGEHIDYNGGYVLPVAITIGTYAKVNKRDDQMIILSSKNFPENGELKIDLNENLIKENNWTDYVKGVIETFRKHDYEITQGLDVIVKGNIPNSSGLSSSASLEVLFCKIFAEYNDLDISHEQMAILSKEAENNFVGVNCGIMDQFIIANGKKDNAMMLNCNNLAYQFTNCDLDDYVIAVMNTKKKRGLVDSEYNKRREECESALVKFQSVANNDYLCDYSESFLSEHRDMLTENEHKRVKHVIMEQARVRKSFKALQIGDLKTFGKFMVDSHNSLRDDYQVSCKELDTFVDIALNFGAIGARMTGAGFGGCAISLIKEADKEAFEKYALSKYKSATAIEGEIYFVNVGDGVRKL